MTGGNESTGNGGGGDLLRWDAYPMQIHKQVFRFRMGTSSQVSYVGSGDRGGGTGEEVIHDLCVTSP